MSVQGLALIGRVRPAPVWWRTSLRTPFRGQTGAGRPGPLTRLVRIRGPVGRGREEYEYVTGERLTASGFRRAGSGRESA